MEITKNEKLKKNYLKNKLQQEKDFMVKAENSYEAFSILIKAIMN